MFPFSKASNTGLLLPHEAQQRVVAAIQQAERNTSGEIRVFMEPHCRFVNACDRAWEVFFKLEMERTQLRNAVLVYLATSDRQFAIIGDEGIYQRTRKDDYWQKEAAILKDYLRQDKMADGLCLIIHEIGNALSAHFPYDAATDKNELPDEIVFGK